MKTWNTREAFLKILLPFELWYQWYSSSRSFLCTFVSARQDEVERVDAKSQMTEVGERGQSRRGNEEMFDESLVQDCMGRRERVRLRRKRDGDVA